MEGADELVNHFDRIPLGIDGHEYRLHFSGEVGVVFFELDQPLRKALHIRGANVGAGGEAEIDHSVFAVEVRPTHTLARIRGQREIAAKRRSAQVDAIRRWSGRCFGAGG